MAPTRLFAQMTVTDLEPAVAWYTKLFGANPDARPMDGLVEWHLAPTFGVQVWLEPERSGRSSMLLAEPDLDELAARLTGASPTPASRTTALCRSRRRASCW